MIYRLWFALALALTLGSLPPAAPAHSQVAFRYLVDLVNPPATFCVDGSRDIRARLLASGSLRPGDALDKAAIMLPANTTLSAVVADASIGDITSIRPQSLNDPEPYMLRPSVVAFTFTGKKAGKTTLTFLAVVGAIGETSQAQPFTLPVTVTDCPYQIKSTSNFKMPGESFTASMDWTDLTVDRNGQFNAIGNVTWAGQWQVVPAGVDAGGVTCDTTLTAPSSPAYITGQVSAGRILTLDIIFTPVKGPFWHVECGGVPPVDRNEFKLALERLKVSVPLPAGGTVTKKQMLIDTAPGSVTVQVEPLK
jgi:hypothetical protein